ncbi:MAG: OmpA family protein [Siculibacillus sp.]
MITEQDGSTAAEEGENYFVSMTDMMVGVLFVFIIMLMTFALDFRSTTDVQEGALEVAKQVAVKLDALQADVHSEIVRMEKASQDRRKMLVDIRGQLASEGLDVQVDEANGVLRLTEDAVRFATGRADLVDRNKDNVGRIARVLERVLPKYVACRGGGQTSCRATDTAAIETVFIEGHTDTTGHDADNWQLSTARAVATYRELITVAPSLRTLLNQKREEIVSVSGYAATRPIDARSTREALDRNRRIDLRFVMATENREGLEKILRVADDMRAEIARLRAAGIEAKP